MKHAERLRKTAMLSVAAIAAALALWRFSELREAFLFAVSWLETAVRGSGAAGAAAFVVLAALSALLSPFSSAPVVPVAVAIWGSLPAFTMLLLGWMLGGIAAYAAGRYAAHPVLKAAAPWKRIEKWKSEIPEKPAFMLALIARLALPSEVGYAYGALRYGFLNYLIVTFAAELPVALVLVYASDALLQGRLAALIISVGALVVFTAIAARAFTRRRRLWPRP